MASTRTKSPDPTPSSSGRLRRLIQRIDRKTLLGLIRLLHALRDPVVLVVVGGVQIWLMLR
ncbi:MAG: hypothetical protein L6R30_06535 [Thermoanaerobaculia bacterium]|nr:hypothetical protein [Thermoanaerobaculia bacterium]